MVTCMWLHCTAPQLYTGLEVVPIEEEEIMGWGDSQQDLPFIFFLSLFLSNEPTLYLRCLKITDLTDTITICLLWPGTTLQTVSVLTLALL